MNRTLFPWTFAHWLPPLTAPLAAVILCLTQMAPKAQGAGFWLLERGAESFGRGGANIAEPQSPLGLSLNPAGLAGLMGLQVEIDGNMFFDSRRFERDTLQALPPKNFEPVDNLFVPMFPSPGVAMAYNFADAGLPALTLAGGVFGPVRDTRLWPEDGSQRYSEISADHVQIQYNLSAAYALPWHGLRLGASLQLIDQIFDTSLKLAAPVVTPTRTSLEDPGYDALVHILASEKKIPHGVFGLAASPTPWLKIGLSVQLPYRVQAKGTADITLGQEYQDLDAEVQGDEVALAVSFPTIARAGVRYVDPGKLFDVELGFVYEAWSVNEEIHITPKDIYVTNPLNPDEPVEISKVVLEQGWRDAFSIRLGGSYALRPEFLTLRAGLFYERSAVPLSRLSPGSFDLDKVGVTGGVRYAFGDRFWFNLALGVIYWLPAEVSDGETKIRYALSGEEGHSIADGRYSNIQYAAQIGLGMTWGE